MTNTNINYSMDTIRGNSVYENNYVSDLSEFTDSEKEILLNRGEVCVSEGYYDEDGIYRDAEYTCIHEDED